MTDRTRAEPRFLYLLNENEAFNDENIAGAIARLVGSPNGIER
ncbi:MAG: hypothetical protein O7F69_06520 [Alphaproteobacteria bacterium]|nr:hypothetical protein [Alphaproteobacteria bacterium]